MPWWVWLLIVLFPIPWGPWWLTIISLSLFGLLVWLLDPKIEKPMTQGEILDRVLLLLADEFEVGNERGRAVDSASTESEPLRKCVAMLIAEGSITEFTIASQRTGMYRLTSDGYNKYKPRIDALRVVPPAST